MRGKDTAAAVAASAPLDLGKFQQGEASGSGAGAKAVSSCAPVQIGSKERSQVAPALPVPIATFNT